MARDLSEYLHLTDALGDAASRTRLSSESCDPDCAIGRFCRNVVVYPTPTSGFMPYATLERRSRGCPPSGTTAKKGRRTMEATFRELLDHAPLILRKPSGEIVDWTRGCCELFGYRPDEAVGRVSHELLKTVFPDNREAIAEQLRETREWTGRLRHTAEGGKAVWTLAVWWLRDSPDLAGPIVVEQNTDITDYVELEEQRDLLALELEHRVKNLLAIVQALARMSFPEAGREQQDKFQMRLAALARANHMLWAGSWDEADVRELVIEVAQALGLERRLFLTGPPARIGPAQAAGFALAVHELSTNALKYGALSVPGGHVEITWCIDPAGDVSLRWEEKGGPAPDAAASAGFGTRLIKNAIPGRGPSSVDLRFEAGGVICEMRLPSGSVA